MPGSSRDSISSSRLPHLRGVSYELLTVQTHKTGRLVNVGWCGNEAVPETACIPEFTYELPRRRTLEAESIVYASADRRGIFSTDSHTIYRQRQNSRSHPDS